MKLNLIKIFFILLVALVTNSCSFDKELFNYGTKINRYLNNSGTIQLTGCTFDMHGVNFQAQFDTLQRYQTINYRNNKQILNS